MKRKHWHGKVCKSCGKRDRISETVSATGLCRDCGRARMEENLTALQTGRGPFAAWWAYRLADAVWSLPVDGAPERP